jgi:Protein of unknown function (DUF1566)
MFDLNSEVALIGRLALIAKLALFLVVFGASSLVRGQAPQMSPDRFQVSADGQEVIDQEKQLVWRRCLEGMRYEDGRCLGEPQPMAWASGHVWAKSITSSGNPWRMPTMIELSTMMDMSRHGSPLNATLFPDTPKAYVWSATVNERTPTHAWAMLYTNGYMMSSWQTVSYYLRLVREKS